MSSKWKSCAVSILLALSLTTPYAKAETSLLGGKTLSEEDLGYLEERLYECKNKELDLVSVSRALEECLEADCGAKWYQDPVIIGLLSLLSLSAGIVIGASH